MEKLEKKLQEPGRDLSTNLLSLVQNARNEITNKLGHDYDEDKILTAMKNILVCHVNVAEMQLFLATTWLSACANTCQWSIFLTT